MSRIRKESVEMFYKVPAESELGRKCEALEAKLNDTSKALAEFVKKYGFKGWVNGMLAVKGDIICCVADETYIEDIAAWKRVKDTVCAYSPRLNTKIGKAIRLEMNKLPRVTFDDLNLLVNAKIDLNHIGFGFLSNGFYGITTRQDWDVNMPKDAIQISPDEYKNLFQS